MTIRVSLVEFGTYLQFFMIDRTCAELLAVDGFKCLRWDKNAMDMSMSMLYMYF